MILNNDDAARLFLGYLITKGEVRVPSWALLQVDTGKVSLLQEWDITKNEVVVKLTIKKE